MTSNNQSQNREIIKLTVHFALHDSFAHFRP